MRWRDDKMLITLYTHRIVIFPTTGQALSIVCQFINITLVLKASKEEHASKACNHQASRHLFANNTYTMLWSRCSSLLWAIIPALYCISYINAAPTDSEPFALPCQFRVPDVRLVVPSAASFYVPNLPDLHQDNDHPLHIYAGHIESGADQGSNPKDVTPHLYFVLVKARRTADKERVMFWFNVCRSHSNFCAWS